MDIDDIIARFTRESNDHYYYISHDVIIAIAIAYSQLELQKLKANYKINLVKKGFAIGFKKGYMLRSDRAYDRKMFGLWKKHVAPQTEKDTEFENDEIEILEIVEPEVVIISK